jgi:hypothetical protein
LSENEELMRKWIYDSKKWQDVFTCKPYEYLNLVAQMKTPWFDRNNGVWVDKDEFDASSNNATQTIDTEIEESRKAMTEASIKANDFAASLTLNDEDDMPF